MAEGKSKTSIEIKLKNVRLSFFNCFTPQEGRDDNDVLQRMNYNTNFLIPKKDPQVEIIKQAMNDVKLAMWPDKDSRPKFAADKMCLRDGEPHEDLEDKESARVALYDGYAGHFFLSANSPVELKDYDLIVAGKKARPVSIIGPKKDPKTGKFRELEESDDYAPYSGSFVNAVVQIYAYKGDSAKKRPARINCSIEAVQWKSAGDSFGKKKIDVNSAFDEEEDDEIGGESQTSGSSSMDDEDDLAIG